MKKYLVIAGKGVVVGLAILGAASIAMNLYKKQDDDVNTEDTSSEDTTEDTTTEDTSSGSSEEV